MLSNPSDDEIKMHLGLLDGELTKGIDVYRYRRMNLTRSMMLIPKKKVGTKLAQGYEGNYDKTVSTTRVIRISKETYDEILEKRYVFSWIGLLSTSGDYRVPFAPMSPALS